MWLLEPASPDSVFTPERMDGEHRLIRQTADEFVQHEVMPSIERLDAKDWPFVRELVRRCGDLGLLGTDVPEEYGGLALDKVSSLIVGEAVGRLASWAVTFGGQTGLSITPLLCFGTPEQKQRYLPSLVSGEMVGAYALSETGSGSDALGARCRATRQGDGSFRLNGEKMWITNGGFADYFTVFARVHGDGAGDAGLFTAFLVERAFAGVSTGKEEHKMGLHGSSTTPLILQDVAVPATHVLGEVGKGHKVAFNVLNYGRFKLGAMCSGGARFVVGEAAKYAAERRQFGRPIGDFGAIRHKLSEMCARLYAVESMLYRIAGLLDTATANPDSGEAGLPPILAALERYALEASIVKVAGSEMMDYVVDENVQIHGGNGFVRDYAAERHYRDARVNRIFEGTNEINRLIIPTMMARRMAGAESNASGQHDAHPSEHGSAESASAVRRAAQMVMQAAIDTHGKKLGEEQDVLLPVADVLIETFACDSVVARAAAAGGPLHDAAAAIYVTGAAARAEIAARDALAALDAPAESQNVLRRLFDAAPANVVPLRHVLATTMVERRGYPFG